MSALLRAELGRATSRNAFRWYAGLSLVAAGLIAIGLFATTADQDDQRVQLRERYGRALAACESLDPVTRAPDPATGVVPPPLVHGGSRDVDGGATCTELRDAEQVSVDRAGFHLTTTWPPGQPGPEPLPTDGSWSRPSVGGEVVLPVAWAVVLASLAIGATLVGAEWQSGSIVLLLTWEPDRRRLFAAKVAAAGIVCTGAAAAALAATFLALVPTALVKGSMDGVDMSWWLAAGGAVGRGALLAGATACLGAVVAMIGRRTAVALVAVLGYVVLAETALQAAVPVTVRWLLVPNAITFLLGDAASGASAGRSGLAAGATLLAYLAAAGAASAALFVRRDVTTS